MKYVRWIWLNMAGIRVNTLFRIVTGITQVLLGLWMVWLSKQFIDVTIRTGTSDDVLHMALLLFAVVVSAILLRQLYYYLTVKASTHQSNAIRLRVFSSLFHRQMYEDQLHSGDVTSRLSKDIDTVADVTTTQFPQLVVTGSQLLGAFLLMYHMDARLAVALLLVTPLVVTLGKFMAHKLRDMTLKIRKEESNIQMQVQEGMEHNAVLRSLGSEQWVTDRLDGMQEQLRGRVMQRTRFTIVTRVLLAATFSLGYLFAFIWGGLQLRAGVITFGVMTSFLQLVGQIQHPIMQLLNMMPQFFYATASIDRLDEITCQSGAARKRAVVPVMLNAPELRLDDVSFSYATGERQVLNHFTHCFPAGSKTAIMGETGIGKTTLFRLMLAFIQPAGGRIVLADSTGEQPVSDATRENFVFVPQGNTLMSGSVRYNLLLACPEATDEQMRQALHTAMADFVYELPQGIDTILGERAAGLSEGQSQRIAIARSLLRPGSILLLDEISSSLDEATERELFARLFAACPDKTMIFITHRPAVAGMCSEVIRLSGA